MSTWWSETPTVIRARCARWNSHIARKSHLVRMSPLMTKNGATGRRAKQGQGADGAEALGLVHVREPHAEARPVAELRPGSCSDLWCTATATSSTPHCASRSMRISTSGSPAHAQQRLRRLLGERPEPRAHATRHDHRGGRQAARARADRRRRSRRPAGRAPSTRGRCRMARARITGPRLGPPESGAPGHGGVAFMFSPIGASSGAPRRSALRTSPSVTMPRRRSSVLGHQRHLAAVLGDGLEGLAD